MGYTRYWNRTNEPITKEFIDEVKEIIAKSNELGISICDGMGQGEPIINDKEIIFNGNEQLGTDHETFCIDNKQGFNFCKTARKPYDYTVRMVLEIAEEMGIVNDVSSDGENEEICSDTEFIKQQIGYYENSTKKYPDMEYLKDTKEFYENKLKEMSNIETKFNSIINNVEINKELLSRHIRDIKKIIERENRDRKNTLINLPKLKEGIKNFDGKVFNVRFKRAISELSDENFTFIPIGNEYHFDIIIKKTNSYPCTDDWVRSVTICNSSFIKDKRIDLQEVYKAIDQKGKILQDEIKQSEEFYYNAEYICETIEKYKRIYNSLVDSQNCLTGLLRSIFKYTT